MYLEWSILQLPLGSGAWLLEAYIVGTIFLLGNWFHHIYQNGRRPLI